MNEPTRFGFAVIGGGLVGAAIAYGLSRLKKNVALFDEGDVAYRAARGNFGLIWVQGKGLGSPHYSNWTRASARLWPQFAAMLRDETVIDVALDQPGGFHVCLSEHELEAPRLQRLLAQMRDELRHEVRPLPARDDDGDLGDRALRDRALGRRRRSSVTLRGRDRRRHVRYGHL